MRILSSAFGEGAPIPVKYSCDGDDLSPPLQWEDVPKQAASLAIIVDDPDAPSGLFVHWVLFDIPATEKGLTEGVGIAGSEAGGGIQGKNGFGKSAYGGPCPPSGTHRYYFHLYALDTKLGQRPGASRQDVDAAMRGHVLAEAQLMGRYTRRSHRR